MGEKWAIAGLVKESLEAVRKWYKTSETYPGLRRVQYIYANTDIDSPMRQLLVGSVARMLALNDAIPPHWDKALRKNGQLAVDIIKAIQDWKVNQDEVPDPRESALGMEKEKVKVVEKLEEKQEGKARDLSGNGKAKQPAAKEAEKPTTNGYHQDGDSDSTLQS